MMKSLNLSAVENRSAATGSDLGAVFPTETDQLALEFPTRNDVSHPFPRLDPLLPRRDLPML
jgi:hypothetical protein